MRSRPSPRRSWRSNGGAVASLALLLALCAGQALAGSTGWTVQVKDGDVVAVAGDGSPAAFSAKAYAQSLVPAGYRLDTAAPGSRCAIEIDLEPLSLLGDALSFKLVYRRVPGECATPLRGGGYVAARSVRLGSDAPARVDDYVRAAPLLQALRANREVADLAGSEAVVSLTALFERLDQATAKRCERRLTPASLSQFYVGAVREDTIDLCIAWSEDCGQLGDEPELACVSAPLRTSDLNDGVTARALQLPGVHLRFVSAD